MIHYQSIFLGMYIALTLYHFFIYLGRKNDISNLTYSFFGFSTILLMVFTSVDSFPLNFNKYYVATYIPMIFGISCILFLSSIYNLNRIKKFFIINTIIFIATGLCCSLFYLTSVKDFFYLIYSATSVYYLISCTFIFFKEIIKLRQYNDLKFLLVLIGYVSVFVSSIFLTVPQLFNFEFSFGVAYSGFLIMLISFAFALANQNNKEHLELIFLKNSFKKQVEEKTKEIEELNKHKLNFYINIAHETKTPLTLIINYLENHIKKHGLTGELKTVQNNIIKLNRDIHNMLDVEKLENNQDFYNHDQIIDFSEILQEKCKQFNEIAKQGFLRNPITPFITRSK